MDYRFLYWTMNGTAVTTTAAYSFTLKGDRTLVAMFTPLPTAVDDTATAGSGQAITISVLANDLDPVAALSSSNGGLTVVTTTLPAAGTAAVSGDRSAVVYTAARGLCRHRHLYLHRRRRQHQHRHRHRSP